MSMHIKFVFRITLPADWFSRTEPAGRMTPLPSGVINGVQLFYIAYTLQAASL